jgi:peptidyl-prolyl cis-trans isomerase C
MSARKWTIRALAGAALLACVAGQAPAQPPAAVPVSTTTAPANKPAAVVDGEAITRADLENALKMVGPTAVPLTEQQKVQMREDALEMLIEDTLMHQFLRKYAPPATPDQINKELGEMAELLKKQNKTLADLYKDSGMSEAQWRVNVGFRMQWTSYCKAQVTDAVVKKYYDDNKDFFDNVQVRASHILVRVDPKATPQDVAAAKAKLTALRQQLAEKKIDFAAAAKQYSECTSAPNGGDIGFFPRKGRVLEPFAATAFAMQPGQVSDVVQTEYGLHLIMVTDRKAGVPSDFEKIKEDVRMFYVSEMQQNIINQMRKNAKIEKSL